MKTKKLGIALLVMLAFVVTTGTFAYWASGVSGNTNTAAGTITVGSGDTVTTTVNLSAATNSQGADALVPAGFADTGKIESLTLQFDVDWDSTGTDASGLVGDLAVSTTSVLNASSADVSALFNVTGLTGYTVTTDGSATTVTLTITMDEPADQTEYNSVASQDIDFTFTFTVTPQ